MGQIRDRIASIFADKKELGLVTQSKLAQAIGCTQPMISGLLSGDVRLSDEWIEKLCAALEISFSDLDKPTQNPAVPQELRPQKYAELHRMLDGILDLNQELYAKGVKAAIETLYFASTGKPPMQSGTEQATGTYDDAGGNPSGETDKASGKPKISAGNRPPF